MRATSGFKIAKAVFRFKINIPKLLNACYYVTSRCNLKCSFCLRPLQGQELPTEKALKVIDEVCRSSIPFFHFSGGEPLLRKDIAILAKRASDNGCIVGLSTNGTLFDHKNVHKIVKVFDQIFISLDGFANTHDKYRGKGTFKKVIDATTWLRSFGVKVGVMTVVAPWNIDILPSFIEWLRRKVDFVQVQPIHPYPLPPQNRLSTEAISKLIDYLLRLKSIDPNFMVASTNFIKGFELFFDGKILKVCHAGQLYVAIDPMGNLLACGGRTDIVLGNVLEQPIDRILNKKINTTEWSKIDMCQGCWLNCTTQTSMIMSSPLREAFNRIFARANELRRSLL